MADIIIYHNPDCGTSRNALAMIRNAGIEPHVVEYLSNQRIALAIGLTLETVKWNLKKIFQKLGVSSRYDATALARRTGLIE